MKHFFHILLLPLLVALGSCNSIVYDEEYSKDGFYHAQNAVYFHYPEAQDTVRFYSFGALPVDSQKYVMNIPVRIAGVPQKHAQKFKLVVDTASTMKADVHYKALNLEPVIPVDSVDAVGSSRTGSHVVAQTEGVSHFVRRNETDELSHQFFVKLLFARARIDSSSLHHIPVVY